MRESAGVGYAGSNGNQHGDLTCVFFMCLT